MAAQIESFLRFLAEERRLSANTLSAYRNDLRQFEEFLASERASRLSGGHVGEASVRQLSQAGRAEVVDFFLNLREKGYSAATIARKMAAVIASASRLYSAIAAVHSSLSSTSKRSSYRVVRSQSRMR